MNRESVLRRVSDLDFDPPRGWHLQELKGGDIFMLKNGYSLVPCKGEAHGNAFIDNCMLCMSAAWGWALVDDSEATGRRPLESAADVRARLGFSDLTEEERRYNLEHNLEEFLK